MPLATRSSLLLSLALAGCGGPPPVPETPAEAVYRPDPADLSVTVEEAADALLETMGKTLEHAEIRKVTVDRDHLAWDWDPRPFFTRYPYDFSPLAEYRGRFVLGTAYDWYKSMDLAVWTRDRKVFWVASEASVKEYTGEWAKVGELETKPHAWTYRWASLEDARRFADAVAAMMTLSSGNAYTCLVRGRRRYADGKVEEARADARRWLERHPRRCPAVEGRDPVLICDIAWLRDQADQARRQAQAAEQRNDPAAAFEACKRLWACGAPDQSDDPEILERAGRALSRLPQPPPVPEEARRLFIQAKSHVETHAFDRAVPLLQELQEVYPWLPDAHFNRAEVLAELKRFPEAIAAMKDYLRLAPGSPDARAAQDRIYTWEAAQTR